MRQKNVLLAMTGLGVAAALVAVPAVAQAGTSAGTAAVSSVGERKSSAVRAKDKAEAGVLALALAGAGAAAYGVYKVADDGSKSNGS